MRKPTIHFRSQVVDFNHQILLFAENNMKYRPKRHHRYSLLRDMNAKLDIVSAKYPRRVPAECSEIQQQRHSTEGMGTKFNINLLKEHTRETLRARFISAIVVSVRSNIATLAKLLGIIYNQNYRISTQIQVTDSAHHSQDFLLTTCFVQPLHR